MMNCKSASRLISESLDRRLTLGERVRLRFHLLLCDLCRAFRRDQRKLYKKLREREEPWRDEKLSAAARAEIEKRLAEEGGESSRGEET